MREPAPTPDLPESSSDYIFMIMVTKKKPARRRKAAWQTADAKANLSSVLAAAERAPQIIHRHARPVAVVLSYEAYARLTGSDPTAVTAPSVAETLNELRPLLAGEDEPLPAAPRSSRALPRGLRPNA